MDLKKYIYGHCLKPVKVKIWDSYSQNYITRYLPCGKCLHCQNTHINEWCTRLIAQRKYSKYCYYVSLDYAPFDVSNKTAEFLAKETAACYHTINKNKTYGLHPLVLCKNHLQDFFKRLRKKINFNIQYFACGEYGMHANGRGYGRPHFHTIIFSNNPISEQTFIDSWTIDGYVIGRVDYKDVNLLGNDYVEQLKIFKYVSKYLQKADFDFEQLATIDFHRAYFKSLEYFIIPSTDQFSPDLRIAITDEGKLKFDWLAYIKRYSPFIVCSRRPAIGSQYFEDNLERFKAKDFRLFGLPDICTTFPRYYVRRTKESLIDFRCIGEVSKKPTTSSRLGNILQVLSFLRDTRLSIENWSEKPVYSWCICKNTENELCIECNNQFIKCSNLSFYDCKNKFLYQFNGYNYTIWCKLKKGIFSVLDHLDIVDVINEVKPYWCRYYNDYIVDSHNSSVLLEKDFQNSIDCMYKGDNYDEKYKKFIDEVYARYKVELASRYKTKLLMQNSKQTL